MIYFLISIIPLFWLDQILPFIGADEKVTYYAKWTIILLMPT